MEFQYEFRNIESHEDPIYKLNEWGRDGWEVCNYYPTSREQFTYGDAGMTNTNQIIRYTKCLLKRCTTGRK